ncbi:MAG: hypothetical protein IKK20_00260 [Clostridia bacterium]|nr:hypothetical protein [Clostridia bacterium]
MTIGEIKIEAIKLMFVNYEFDFKVGELERMKADENYGSYLVNMDGAIARALDRIENACVLPAKVKKIEASEFKRGKVFDRYDTSQIKNYFQIDRVTAEYDNGSYDGNIGFEIEGDELLLRHNPAAEYSIIYFPKAPSIKGVVDNSTELDLPENIARLIPYFIKGDLFQEEEPALAADARNLFEASLDDLKRPVASKQEYIEQVYRMW